MLVFYPIPPPNNVDPQYIGDPLQGEYYPVSISNDLEWQLVEAEENSLAELMRRETAKIKVSKGILAILRIQLQAAASLDDDEQAAEDGLSEHCLRIMIKAEEANLADLKERQSHIKYHFEYHLDELHERVKEEGYLTAFHYLEMVSQCARFKKILEEFVMPKHQDWLVWAYQEELILMNSADNGAVELTKLMIGESEVVSGGETRRIDGIESLEQRDLTMDEHYAQSTQKKSNVGAY